MSHPFAFIPMMVPFIYDDCSQPRSYPTVKFLHFKPAASAAVSVLQPAGSSDVLKRIGWLFPCMWLSSEQRSPRTLVLCPRFASKQAPVVYAAWSSRGEVCGSCGVCRGWRAGWPWRMQRGDAILCILTVAWMGYSLIYDLNRWLKSRNQMPDFFWFLTIKKNYMHK